MEFKTREGIDVQSETTSGAEQGSTIIIEDLIARYGKYLGVVMAQYVFGDPEESRQARFVLAERVGKVLDVSYPETKIKAVDSIFELTELRTRRLIEQCLSQSQQ